jgi:hypothetical protein
MMLDKDVLSGHEAAATALRSFREDNDLTIEVCILTKLHVKHTCC